MRIQKFIVGALGLALSAAPSFASTAQFSVQTAPNAGGTGGTYQVFETITDGAVGATTSFNLSNGTMTAIPAGQSLGIYDTDVLATSAGGITLGTGVNQLPKVSNGLTLDNASQVDAGFTTLPHSTLGTDASGNNTFDIGAAQDLTVQFNSMTHNTDLITGFGVPGQTSGPAGDGMVNFSDPVLVAQGTYNGTTGTIMVQDLPGGAPTNTLLLGSALPPTNDSTQSGQQTTPHVVADVVNQGLNVTGGTLTVTSTTLLPSGTSLSIAANGSVQIAKTTPAITQNLTGLSIDSGGKLDVTNATVQINYGNGKDPDSAVAALVLAGKKTPGTGIFSSTAASNEVVGYMDNTATHTELLKLTLFGDINLDGKVNNSDFFLFKKAFGTSIGQPGYNPQFDFNSDGKINNTDFFQFKKDFGMSTPAVAFAEVSAVSAVPEPSTAGLVLIGAVGLLSSRRRR